MKADIGKWVPCLGPCLLLIGLGWMTPVSTRAAGPQLYDTGPAQDAAFIRFVNATGAPLDVVADARVGSSAKARKLVVGAVPPSGPFMSIRPGVAMAGHATQGAGSVAISPKAEAGELLTVVFWSVRSGAIGSSTVAELPKNFNGLKASIAFYNFDDSCPDAKLTLSGRDSVLFEHGAPQSFQRRAVNPIAVSLQAMCGAQRAGPALDLGLLEPGQRYSVFLTPGKMERNAFWARDELAP